MKKPNARRLQLDTQVVRTLDAVSMAKVHGASVGQGCKPPSGEGNYCNTCGCHVGDHI
jgi:hypothetical protein